MKKILFLFIFSLSIIGSKAQVPPSSMYENLRIYESIILFVDGQEEEFDGKDYLYLDYESDNLYVLFPTQYGWEKSEAEYWNKDDGYSVYTVDNPNGEELTLKISASKQDIIAYKDGNKDFTLGYEVISTSVGCGSNASQGNGYYGGYNSGGYNSNRSSSSSSGRTCISCGGTGKCKTCDGKGWYYHETGYYTGNSHQTRTDCPVCRGTGNCGTCHGAGNIR